MLSQVLVEREFFDKRPPFERLMKLGRGKLNFGGGLLERDAGRLVLKRPVIEPDQRIRVCANGIAGLAGARSSIAERDANAVVVLACLYVRGKLDHVRA